MRDPPGFSRDVHTTATRTYSIWRGPDGQRFRSHKQAWAAYVAQIGAGDGHSVGSASETYY